MNRRAVPQLCSRFTVFPPFRIQVQFFLDIETFYGKGEKSPGVIVSVAEGCSRMCPGVRSGLTGAGSRFPRLWQLQGLKHNISVMELWLGMDRPGFILPSEFYPIHTERLRWVLKEINVPMALLLPEFSGTSVCGTEGILQPPGRNYRCRVFSLMFRFVTLKLCWAGAAAQ